MKNSANVICFALFLLLIGCGGNESNSTDVRATIFPQPQSPSPAVMISSPTGTAILTETPTATLDVAPSNTVHPTMTGTQIPASTPTIPLAMVEYQCLDVEPEPPTDVNSTGNVVLQSREILDNGWISNDTFLLDMATGESVQIAKPGENQVDHIVSPNRELMAYESVLFDEAGEIIQDDLVIAAADGQLMKTIPWDEDVWGRLLGWLDNERLVINISTLDPDESEAHKAATLLALNPFSGETQILKPDFPGIYDLYPVYSWDGWSVRTYDPGLTRASYLQITDDGDWALALWDLQEQQLLASLIPYRVSVPRWSPDGSRLVTNAPISDYSSEELFLMGRDGQIEQLTNMDAYFLEYSWSPDGRYIAAWMTRDSIVNPEEVELVIVDTSTQQVIDYCIREKYNVPLKMYWSPDGQQLILYVRDKENHGQVILVDRVQGFAAQIATDMEPYGWMLVP